MEPGTFSDAGAAPVEETADEHVGADAVVVDMGVEPAPSAPPPAPPAQGPPTSEGLTDLGVQLEWFIHPTKGERFHLLRRIKYQDGVDDDPTDHDLGAIVVPADLDNWDTDLTSVPWFLTWLIPTTGEHLPAAILHDGLVLNRMENGEFEPASYIARRVIHRDEADRIFRDAMAQTGTGVVRRWLVWSAVTVATMWKGEQVAWSRGLARYYKASVGLTFLVIGLLGVWATLDLVDVDGVCRVPWMGETPVGELAGGLAGAIVIPLVLAFSWREFRAAGWIIGPLVAFVVPVLLVVFPAGYLYRRLERLDPAGPGVLRAVLAGVVVVASLTVAWFLWQTGT